MRGRKLFKVFKPILIILQAASYVFPKKVLIVFWPVIDLFPGKLGVGLRYVVMARLVKKVGINVYIGRNVEIIGWENIELGDNVSIHKGCYIDGKGGLTVGNDVSVAHESSILTFDHTWDDKSKPIRENPLIYKRVEICDDVWVGCGCRILSGVKIDQRSIIAAGSIVTKDVDSCSLYAGVPAKRVKGLC